MKASAVFEALAKEIDDSFVKEHRFSERKWRFDYAWTSPELAVAVEIDGAVWTGGRHVRGAGVQNDMEKINAAVILGWRVLRFTTGMVLSDPRYVSETLRAVLKEGR